MNSAFLFSARIHDLVSRIETSLALPSTTNSTNFSASDLYNASCNRQNNHHIAAKLSKIEIPKFHGKPVESQSFCDQFSVAVDSKTSRNLSGPGAPSDRYGKLLVHLLTEKISHSLNLVLVSSMAKLENMLKYFKKELFAKEHCASLVNEKPYNPYKCNENTIPTFLSG